jgi:hypothetical protein
VQRHAIEHERGHRFYACVLGLAHAILARAEVNHLDLVAFRIIAQLRALDLEA